MVGWLVCERKQIFDIRRILDGHHVFNGIQKSIDYNKIIIHSFFIINYVYPQNTNDDSPKQQRHALNLQWNLPIKGVTLRKSANRRVIASAMISALCLCSTDGIPKHKGLQNIRYPFFTVYKQSTVRTAGDFNHHIRGGEALSCPEPSFQYANMTYHPMELEELEVD